jgi:hypothetical protein
LRLQRWPFCAVLLTLALTVGAVARQKLPPRPQAGEGAPGFKLTLTSFAPTRAYAVGAGSLQLVGTVRNEGQAALPADTVTLRMYTLAGLDYLEGATAVRLPAMEPGAAVTYRWKVQPTEPDAPLVAALVLERPGHVPQIRVLPIQHFAEAPSAFGSGTPVKPEPTARSASSSGWLDNGKVRVRAFQTDSEVAGAFLWSKTAGGWRQTGVALPVVEVLSAEGAQDPWWELFKTKRFVAASSPKSAGLSLSGLVGVRWRASVSFALNAGSSVVDAEMTLSPRRTMKLYGLRVGRYHAGEGSFGAASSETIGPEPVGSGLASAVRWGPVTTGITWPAQPPFEGWSQALLQTPDGGDYTAIGVEYRCGPAPALLQAGATVKLRWRWYALTPSTTVRDALKVSF